MFVNPFKTPQTVYCDRNQEIRILVANLSVRKQCNSQTEGNIEWSPRAPRDWRQVGRTLECWRIVVEQIQQAWEGKRRFAWTAFKSTCSSVKMSSVQVYFYLTCCTTLTTVHYFSETNQKEVWNSRSFGDLFTGILEVSSDSASWSFEKPGQNSCVILSFPLRVKFLQIPMVWIAVKEVCFLTKHRQQARNHWASCWGQDWDRILKN